MAPATDVLLPGGTVLGRHRVLGRITEGAMAVLYLGEHIETGAKVAVKVLRSALVEDGIMLARFAREAEVMGRLSGHDNIVHVHDMGTLDDGRRYLVMDLVRGSDLAFALHEAATAGEPMSAERACRILRDIAAGLVAAHGKQVVHRDVTPSNVMLAHHFDGSGETAKLVDFGVSSDLGVAGRAADLTVGSVIGTPEYMAPEQAAGAPAAPSFDIFALGVVAYEMLAGKRPSVTALRTGQLPDLGSIRSDLPPELVQVVHACLLVDVDARIGSAQEVTQRIDAVLVALVRTRATTSAWAGARPERAVGVLADRAAADDVIRVTSESHLIDRARPRRWATAAVLVVLAGASGWWFWAERGRTTTPTGSTEPAHASEASAAAPDPLGEPVHVTSPGEPASAASVVPSAPTPKHPSDGSATGGATPANDPTPTAEPAAPVRDPRPRPKARPDPSPVAAPADHESEACQELRAEVIAAKRSQDWAAIAAKTADRSCWPTNAERLRHRTAALLELGRIDDCIREGGSSNDAKVKLQVDQCRRKKGQ